MPAAVEVRQSFTVQSPGVVFGMASVAERADTLIPLLEPGPSDLPALYTDLAALYTRVPRVDDSSGGLPGDPYSF
jgi:hypothetical protein